MMDLLEQAVALGDAMMNDARFMKMREAREQNDADPQLQEMMQEFTVLRGDLMRENAKEEPNGEKMMELDAEVNELYTKIMQNEHMQAYAQAQVVCEELVQKMKRVLDFAMAGQDPAEALSEQSGCGGSCSGCAGC